MGSRVLREKHWNLIRYWVYLFYNFFHDQSVRGLKMRVCQVTYNSRGKLIDP